MPERVIVIGGGLAGLAAAQKLAEHHFQVTVLESRNRLGGRAGSFVDGATGELIDACQHVSMGCCTELHRFFRTMGVEHFLAPQPELTFLTADGRASRFRADHLPAPFHLARSFADLHFLSAYDKAMIAWGLLCLRVEDDHVDPPFIDWLRQHRQSARSIENFWSLVLVSALNESVNRIGLKYARKVFVDGFLRERDGFTVYLPTVPLHRLYGKEMQSWFARRSVTLRLNCAVKGMNIKGNCIDGLNLRNGERLETDWYVAAVPYERLPDMFPSDVIERDAALRRTTQLQSSPITSVHLWFDRQILDQPHVVLVGCLSQWIFQRPGGYAQVVISAARDSAALGHDELERRVIAEVKSLFPTAQSATVTRSRVVTEKAATFSAVPGVDHFRPGPCCSIDNLALAGDWTNTGWPATMEGAVRSGYAAAELVIES